MKQEDDFREELLFTEHCFDVVEETLREHNFPQIADKVKYNRYDSGPYRILRQVSIEFLDNDDEKLIDFYLRINPHEPHYEDLITYFLVSLLATFFGTYFATKLTSKKEENEKKDLIQNRRKKLSDCCVFVLKGYMLRQMLYERQIALSEYEDFTKKIRNGEKNNNYHLVEKYEIKFLKEHDLKQFEEIIIIMENKLRIIKK